MKFNIPTTILLNNLNTYDSVNTTVEFVGFKPQSCLWLLDELYTKSIRYITRLNNYIINDNQDETIPYDNLTTRYITTKNQNSKTKQYELYNIWLYNV